MWLEAKKRVEYIHVPKIMIDDWLNKGNTNLNMFFVVGEQIRSLSSKELKLNFWNQLHPKIAFYAVSGHKQSPDNQTIQFWHQVSKEFWKLWLTHFFLGPSLGGVRFLKNGGRFFQRERVLCGWLAGPSHIMMLSIFFLSWKFKRYLENIN